MGIYRPPSYVTSISNRTGVVTEHVWMTLFNPAGSGKVVIPLGVFVSAEANAASASTESLRGNRITAATDGTLAALTAIAKAASSMPDPVAEVRIDNPTVTLGPQVFNSPPPTSAGAYSSGFVHDVPFAAAPGGFLLLPGEGISMRTISGDTAQRWNVSVFWAER